MKANIASDLTSGHQEDIERILRNILSPLENRGLGQIVVCMNETNEKDPAPVFVGYLLGKEMEGIRKQRGDPDPGVARFGDRATSFMYDECFRKGGRLEVDRTAFDDQIRMKRTEIAQSLTRGITYLMLRAINVDGKWAGVLGIGFKDNDKPKDRDTKHEFEAVLTDLVTRSELVAYLRDTFNPGGPRVSGDNEIQAITASISQAIIQGIDRLAEVLRTSRR